MVNFITLQITTALIVLTIFVSKAYPLAFRLIDEGTAAGGQGDAFVAQADDPSAIFYNPAGLIQVKGVNIYAGGNLIDVQTDYTIRTGETGRMDGDLKFPPNFYISSDLNSDRIAVGIGLISPFGLAVNYEDTGPLRFVVTSAKLEVIDINPTIAYKVNDVLSIGAGINIFLANVELENRVDFGASPLVGSPGSRTFEGNSDFKDRSASAIGYNLGVLYKPTERLSFGVSYRSRADLEVDGTLRIGVPTPLQSTLGSAITRDASMRIVLPNIIRGGVAYWPLKDEKHSLKLEFDLDWTSWEDLDSFTLRLDEPIPALPNPERIPSFRNFDNTFAFLFGVEYGRQLNDNTLIKLRTGYIYAETPVPEETFDPIIPDADRHVFSIGGGVVYRKFNVDFLYQAFFFEERNVDTQARGIFPNSPSINGRYDSFANVIGLSIGYRF